MKLEKRYRAMDSGVCTETKNIVDAQRQAEERERESECGMVINGQSEC